MTRTPESSPTLKALLSSLGTSNGGLSLDSSTLTGTGAESLLTLFEDRLQIDAFQLDGVQLPAAVTDSTLHASGSSEGVTLDLTFQDVGGEVAIEALFHAPALAPLKQAFPKLGEAFFKRIADSDATARVTVPGLEKLTIASPSYGVIGRVTPVGGFSITSIAPRVDGQLAPNGPGGLAVELETDSAAYRIAARDWTFAELPPLLGDLAVLDVLADTMLPKDSLVLRSFELILYSGAPGLSSLTLDVAHSDDPDGTARKPLWLVGDAVHMTDVVVRLDLTYASSGALLLAGTGWVEGKFELGTSKMELDAQIPFPTSGIWSLTAYPNVSLPGLGDIVSLFDGGSTDSLPAGMDDIGSLELTYLRLAIHGDPFALSGITAGLGTSEKWTLIPGVLELSSLQIRLTIDSSAELTGSVVGVLELPEHAEVVVSFARNTPSAPWRFDAISPAIALPSLDQLARLAHCDELAGKVTAGGLGEEHFVMTDLNLGLTVSPRKTTLTNLGATFQLAGDDKDHPLDPKLDWELIPGVLKLTRFALGFQVTIADTTTKVDALGSFVLNGLEFDVRFVGDKGDALIAEYFAHDSAGTVDVKHLIASISPAIAEDMPDGLEIDLDDALLAYLSTGSKFLFAMDVAATVKLSDLPLVGTMLPADAELGLKSLKVVVASDPMSVDDVRTINDMSPKPVLTPPKNASGEAIPKGVSMVAELELGALVIEIATPPAAKQTQATQTTSTTQALPAPAAAPGQPAAPTPAVKPKLPAAPGLWKDVGKSIGPAELRRVGVAWADGCVWLLMDAGFSAGGLAIDLQGLGLGAPVTDPTDIQPDLHGLAVSFSEGPVQISGGLVEIGTGATKQYDGELLIELEVLQIAAVGSWATDAEGHPSLFVFAVLNEPPLGGPAFFYVTGLAFGFGYNRALVLPAVDQLPSFPLVSVAMAGAEPAAKKFGPADMSAVLPPTPGVNWLAAGVRFSSFELLQSFALLTVEFGRGFQVALLGLSTLATPPDEPEPIVFAELALEASYTSETGLVAVSAQLTPASYLLSSACKLTGGFAFYLWTKDAADKDGPRAGDFVVTLGGYNPHFVPPPGYPSVPRVGANWQVSKELVVKAGMYLAVTPSCVMAGGSLEAVWHSDGLDVTFTAQADFLLGWKPFHYEANASVTLTARVQVKVIVTITITIHLGVWLELYGPPFGGKAHVDLDVVSFTIAFGAAKPDRQPIPWSDFTKGFLPQRTGPETWCGVRVLGGLERDLTKAGGDVAWVVNGEQLLLQTFTVVPATEVWMAADGNAAEHVDSAAASFGVGPVGVADGDIASKHTVSLKRLDAKVSTDSLTKHLARSAATGNQPRALWSVAAAMTDSIAQAKPATVPDMHTGLLLEAKPPAGTGPTATADELRAAAETRPPVAWHAAKAGVAAAPPKDLGDALSNRAAVDRRTAIAAILNASGAALPAAPSTALLSKAAGAITAPPAYAEVGD